MTKTTLAGLSYRHTKKQTRREQFPSEMDRVVSWKQRLDALIEPYFLTPTAGRAARVASDQAAQ